LDFGSATFGTNDETVLKWIAHDFTNCLIGSFFDNEALDETSKQSFVSNGA
jgi:hypothetical protein